MCVCLHLSPKMDQSRGDLSFTSKGFKNWNDATVSFKNHEASASHKDALQVMVVIPSTCQDVSEILPQEHAREE